MVPSVWRKSIVVPVPKKRNKGVCKKEDFRGIALVSVVYKAMCLIVQERLMIGWIEANYGDAWREQG